MVPAFLTLTLIPLTLSITQGLLRGLSPTSSACSSPARDMS